MGSTTGSPAPLIKISQYVAFPDTCVLAPMPVMDTLLRLAGREKKSAKAGETACATFASPLFAVVGQALSPANAACGRFFLTTAEEPAFYTPKWSPHVIEELKKTLTEKFGYSPEQVIRRVGAMESAFPSAMVTG
jgi:hypothetical protein